MYEIWIDDYCFFKTEKSLEWCIGFAEGYANGISDCGGDDTKMLIKMHGSIIWDGPLD
jgi:hypothetical protein